ncbi:MAG: replicative DNA helicase [Lachnospiraceae bacterium]|nr:replicative DNA helicase [Lachnospiraceae bacterium]
MAGTEERENQIKRVRPHSLGAEQTVLGSMLLDNECIPKLEGILTGQDFYTPMYGVIFDAMMELYNEGRPVDPVTLQDRLQQKDVAPEVSNPEFIGELIASVPVSANAKYYAEIVAEKALLRRIIGVNEEVAGLCYAEKESVGTIVEETERKIFDVLNRRRQQDIVPIDEITRNALTVINEAALSRNPITGLATGFKDLDEMLTGLHPSELILIGARPSMGKTALVLNILQNVVFRQDQCAVLFSLEMAKEMIMNRLLSMEGHVDAQRLRSGELNDEDWDKLFEAAETISRSKLIIDETSGITVSDLRSKCRKIKLERDLKLIVIDYLQLMSGSGRRSENRQQEITEISRGLKALARELRVPVIALSQVSRAPDARKEDHRPLLSDLRESGSIEQDADVVMFIYRDEYYNKENSKKKGITELIVAKQRNGPVGTVELAWLPQNLRFANISKEMRMRREREAREQAAAEKSGEQ